MFETDKIRQLIEMMVKNDLVEISLRDGDVEVSLRRPNPASVPSVQMAGGPATVPAVSPSAIPEESPDMVDDGDEVGLVEIVSPMVGTFYSASSPEVAPFVSVGSSVGTDTPVCIIEAMKVFNEVKAEVSGTIEKILVKNEQAVEFGQPLYLVRPD